MSNVLVGGNSKSSHIIRIYIVNFRQFLKISIPSLLHEFMLVRGALVRLLFIHASNSGVLLQL